MPKTLVELKDLFMAQIAPGNDVEFVRLLQEADNRLMDLGKWDWVRTVAELTPVDNIITVESPYETLIAVRIDDEVVPVYNRGAEWLDNGPGKIDESESGCRRIYDQGTARVDGDLVRTYKISGGDFTDTVECLLTKEYSVLEADDDYPNCPDPTALKQAMLSVIYEEASDPERSTVYMQNAERQLGKAAIRLKGGAKHWFRSRKRRGYISRRNHNFS